MSNCNFGNNFSDACLRFLKSAEMLPNDTALGLQIKFAKDTVPNVYVFSDAKLSVKDFEWMFNPCAEVSIHKDNAIIIPNETTTYLISQCSSYCTEKSLGESNLIEELCELGATLNVIVPSKSINAAVTLQTSAEISLRVCVMLSNSFHGAEIKDITASCNEEQKHGFSISPDATEKILKICTNAQQTAKNDNGRFCRNLIENAILSYAERVYETASKRETSGSEFVLISEDFSNIQVEICEEKRCIGFNM